MTGHILILFLLLAGAGILVYFYRKRKSIFGRTATSILPSKEIYTIDPDNGSQAIQPYENKVDKPQDTVPERESPVLVNANSSPALVEIASIDDEAPKSGSQVLVAPLANGQKADDFAGLKQKPESQESLSVRSEVPAPAEYAMHEVAVRSDIAKAEGDEDIVEVRDIPSEVLPQQPETTESPTYLTEEEINQRAPEIMLPPSAKEQKANDTAESGQERTLGQSQPIRAEDGEGLPQQASDSYMREGTIGSSSVEAQDPGEPLEVGNAAGDYLLQELEISENLTHLKDDDSARADERPDSIEGMAVPSKLVETVSKLTSEFDKYGEDLSSKQAEDQAEEVPLEEAISAGDERPQQYETAENITCLTDREITTDDQDPRDDKDFIETPEMFGGAGIGTDAEVTMSAETDSIRSPIISVEEIDSACSAGELQEEPHPATAPAELNEERAASTRGVVPQDTTQYSGQKEKRQKKKEPRKYVGLSRGAPESKDNNTRQLRDANGGLPGPRTRSLPIEIRLRFERGGFCSVSLIAKRVAGLPEEVAITTPAGVVDLQAMQDEWYQDFAPADFSRVLQDGTVWTQNDMVSQYSWSLSGRNIYVLADRSDISGFVSQSCLELGREHAVLCLSEIKNDVKKAIADTGAAPIAILDDSLGAPPGWVVFRGVVPTNAVNPVAGADIFNALRPLPQIAISLDRGVRLDYANWLEGYPPLIRVYGDPEHKTEVRIDGQIASCDKDGNYHADGWDLIGSHTIWCSDISRSYTIVPLNSTWERWDAYVFPVAKSSKRKIAVCGPMVWCVSNGPESTEDFTFVSVLQTNPVLLGRAPGEYDLAQNVSGVHGSPLVASPPFHSVWALPRDPLHCDKRSIRILLIGELQSPVVTRNNLRITTASSVSFIETWCRLILDASRKGMKTQPETDTVRAVWLQYKDLAHQIWRAHK